MDAGGYRGQIGKLGHVRIIGEYSAQPVRLNLDIAQASFTRPIALAQEFGKFGDHRGKLIPRRRFRELCREVTLRDRLLGNLTHHTRIRVLIANPYRGQDVVVL